MATSDDQLEELLNEADTLMKGLDVSGVDDGDFDYANDNEDDPDAPSLIIDGFAIDSDDEAEGGGTGIKKSSDVADHPLSEEWLASNTTTTTTPATIPPVAMTTNNNVMGTVPSPLAAAATMDTFKHHTSRFASNLANMAQRAASQVAAVTAVQPMPPTMVQGAPGIMSSSSSSSNGIMSKQHSQQQQPYQSPFGMSPQQQQQQQSMTPPMQQQQQQQPPPLPHSQLQQQQQGLNSYSLPSNPSQQQQPSSNGSIELDKEQKSRLLLDHFGELLPGERIIMFLSNLLQVSDSSGLSYIASQASDSYMWCCVMTYYRLILFCTAPCHLLQPNCPPSWNPVSWPESPNAQTVIEIPLASMDRVDKTVYHASGSSYMGLVISSKDCYRTVRFTTPSYADTGRAYDSLNTYAFPGRRNLGYLFAFESKRQKVMASIQIDEASGQQTITIPPNPSRFDAMMEFSRLLSNTTATATTTSTTLTSSSSSSSLQQSKPSPPWTIWTSINATYQLSPTYPSILVGPATIDETKPESSSMIRQCAAFRSEQRLPALSWCSTGGASIWRSSQPKVGLQGNRSTADELFLRHVVECARSANAIADSSSHIYPRQVLQQLTGDYNKDWTPEHSCGIKILDLRPRSSAMANRTGGYGYENTSNYANSTIQFCNIGNIHAVRDSYQKLCALTNNGSTADVSWNALVEDTKWLSHIRLILAASWEAAYWVHIWRMPVLLHCSHGWDRTSQVSALAQLMLDPYYRTQKGFSTLVEKDFMSFGHPFHTRCAHGEGRNDNKSASAVSSSSNDEGQIAPIFLQFLDCVYQIVQLYPECFEFNTSYLLELSFHIYSCRFGNMLCDTEREREVLAGIRQRTYSVWDYLESDPKWKNSSFVKSDGILLMPLPTLLRNVKLWVDRHCQQGPKPTIRPTMPERKSSEPVATEDVSDHSVTLDATNTENL